MSDTTPGAANLRDIRDALTAIRDAANEHQPVERHHIITIRDRAAALDAARRDAEARCARLRRLAKAEIANSCTDPFNPDQRVRQEVQEAREDCRKHGDLAEPAPARADGGA